MRTEDGESLLLVPFMIRDKSNKIQYDATENYKVEIMPIRNERYLLKPDSINSLVLWNGQLMISISRQLLHPNVSLHQNEVFT